MDTKFMRFLDKKLGRVLPESREKYLSLFKEQGFTDTNHDFVTFWANYNDEIPTKDGFLAPFCNELEHFERSCTMLLRQNSGLAEDIYALFNFEFDDYMLYRKSTDEVFFVQTANLKKFVSDGYYDKQWDSFLAFIKYQMQYQK